MISLSAKPRRYRRKVVRRALAFLSLAFAAMASVAADLRGFVSEGGAGVLQYQPCNGAVMSQQLFPIDDKTPNSALRAGVGAVRQIMLHRYRPLYVEMRGDRGKTTTTAYQFQRAVGTVESCNSLPRDIPANVRLHAAGGAPTWRLVVTDATAVLELPDKVSVRLPGGSFKTAGTDLSAKEMLPRVYEARSADGNAIRVELTPQMCTDGRSESAYGARVVIRFEKRVLQGCAARF